MASITRATHPIPAATISTSEADALAQPGVAESFRLLALNVLQLLPDRQRRSILIVSAQDRDGRSFTAGLLALALFEIAPPVLLVDGDPLGAGGLHRFLTSGKLRLAEPGRAGTGTQTEFVAQTRRVMAEAEAAGFTVVVDTPACTRSSVAFSLANAVGGVLYVARRRAQDPAVHHDVRAQLDLLDAKVLGVVFHEA